MRGIDRNDWDVIIVGGGPAGSAAAIAIATYDPALAARTLVLDRAVFPRHKLCGGAVVAQTDELLRSLGVHIDVPAVPIHAIRVDHPGGSIVHRGHDMFRVVRREDFDHALLAAAKSRGIEVHDGEPVTGLHRDSDCVRLHTACAEYRTQVVIGADGARSLVRRALVGTDGGSLSVALEVLTREEPAMCVEFKESMAVFDFRDVQHGLRGYAWDFPSYRAGTALMNRGMGAVTWPEGRAPVETFAARLAGRSVPFDADAVEGAALRLYNPMTEQSAERVVLAGDAVGVDPLMGEGISTAIGTGIIAAHAVIEAFSCSEFAFDDYRRRISSSAVGWAMKQNWLGAGYFYRLLRQAAPVAAAADGPN